MHPSGIESRALLCGSIEQEARLVGSGGLSEQKRRRSQINQRLLLLLRGGAAKATLLATLATKPQFSTTIALTCGHWPQSTWPQAPPG